MIKLREIIAKLDDGVYKSIENALVKNKADNFLHLLKSYRQNATDNDIIDSLELNSNSFYVLKSRLYDRIQNHLSGDIHFNKEELPKKLVQVQRMCYNESREVMIAYLEKLEKDLLHYDLHNELLVLYSVLKKTHLYSDKYFYYSQLYNKQIAFSLSLEKSEETLGNFSRIMAQYNFSRSEKHKETLFFIRREIGNIYTLNPSRQIELIKNFIDLQLLIFCDAELDAPINAEQLLLQTRKLISELPDSSAYKDWQPALDYLCFEYYFRKGMNKMAEPYFAKLEEGFNTILLYSHICPTPKYLLSKIEYLQERGEHLKLTNEDFVDFVVNPNDMHAHVHVGLYAAIKSFYSKHYKEAMNKLNEVINENSFKDYFHINTDIKLTLCFVYLCIKEYDLAESLIKSIYRKIKSEKIETYPHVLDLIKVFETDIKQNGSKISQKQKDGFTLFSARNIGQYKLLTHLFFELKQKYK